MSKKKEYQVSLNSLGFLDENLHFGPFSRNWWETRQTNNTELYPIRVNMKTTVILRGTEFTLTIVQGNSNSLQQPGYICEAKGKKGIVFDNSSAAITTLYQ